MLVRRFTEGARCFVGIISCLGHSCLYHKAQTLGVFTVKFTDYWASNLFGKCLLTNFEKISTHFCII